MFRCLIVCVYLQDRIERLILAAHSPWLPFRNKQIYQEDPETECGGQQRVGRLHVSYSF